jgi:hypothetical protein
MIRLLYEGVLYTYETLETAVRKSIVINDLNATLIFALIKKFSFGYVLLTLE